MIDAVLFDMDGVLIDSVAAAFRTRSAVLNEYGVDMATLHDPTGEQFKGSSLHMLLTVAQQQTGIVINQDEFARKFVAAMQIDLQEHGVGADPGLLQFIAELKTHQVPLALVTSARLAGTQKKLAVLGLQNAFDVVVTAEDVAQHKPDPESYVAAIAKLGATPARCVVFEDSISGVQAGIAAGAVVIGFTKYADNKQSLAGTTATIDDWSEVSFERLQKLVVAHRQG